MNVVGMYPLAVRADTSCSVRSAAGMSVAAFDQSPMLYVDPAPSLVILFAVGTAGSIVMTAPELVASTWPSVPIQILPLANMLWTMLLRVISVRRLNWIIRVF